MRTEEIFLALSGIQHYLFCPRQWAMIHIEGLWESNYLTVTGDMIHDRAHDKTLKDRYEDKIVIRGLSIVSRELRISGQCDVVEFRRSPGGFPLHGESGEWCAYPVEYKRGRSKVHDADRAQLCAQAMCLEEMFCTDISEGALFYYATRSREKVVFTSDLRMQVKNSTKYMWDLYSRGHTPKPSMDVNCSACSFYNSCLSHVAFKKSAVDYIKKYMDDE